MLLAPLLAAALAASPAATPAPAPAAVPVHGASPAPAPADPHAGMNHDPMLSLEGDTSVAGDDKRFQKVELKIASPKEGEAIPGSDLEIRFELKGYTLPAEQPGPHIHVIIDNQPYVADYDATKPFFVRGLAPGPHTLRAFPSRRWHESIKAPKAFAMAHFFMGPKQKGSGFATWVDARKPILTFSRPKGNYAGDDAKKVMVDFWIKGTKLGPKDSKVKMVLDGKESLITGWKPQFLEGLADGKHTISLELLDRRGAPIANTYNKTEREFSINAPEAPAPAAPAPTPVPVPPGAPVHH
jgi:hypothetical protein